MPKPKRGPRLGAGPAHQRMLLANQASDLFRHGRITTTETKAKHLRPYAERLITKAKRGDLHARRQVLAQLRDRDVVAYLFEEVAPRFTERNGGYTRMLKLGPRHGDNAPMAIVELVEQGTESGDEAIEEAKRSRMSGLFGRRRRAKEAPEPVHEYPLEQEDSATPEEILDEDGDLEDVQDADDADVPSDAQEPTAPDDEPDAPADLADDTPDAGQTTGGGDVTKNP